MSFSGEAVAAEHLGKVYRMYDQKADRLKQLLFWRLGRNYGREFWALRDVSFELAPGDTLGILGRNGSGKSTLLQLIAGTLTPTTGTVCVQGRLAALLELGSGFNPEFSGRENVFLNGTLLGLTTREIEQRFDEIASFADIGAFLDQPVKHYSSGMLMRLAFAVQACVEPDVLIVDEALAVGDFAFQHRCMTRLRKLRERGTSILFVSHDISTIRATCERALLLEHGTMTAIGPAGPIADRYYQQMLDLTSAYDRAVEDAPGLPVPVTRDDRAAEPDDWQVQPVRPGNRWGTGEVKVEAWGLFRQDGTPSEAFAFRERAVLRVQLRALSDVPRCFPGFAVRDRNGYQLVGITSLTCGQSVEQLQAGDRVVLSFEIELLFAAENYDLLFNIAADELGTVFYDVCENVATFTIVREPPHMVRYGYGRMYVPTSLEVSYVPGGRELIAAPTPA